MSWSASVGKEATLSDFTIETPCVAMAPSLELGKMQNERHRRCDCQQDGASNFVHFFLRKIRKGHEIQPQVESISCASLKNLTKALSKSCPKAFSPFGIYGFTQKNPGIKNPEKLDATGFSPVASMPSSGYGGEEGIRTLDTLTTYTRFPIVRFRPAQPPLHDGGVSGPISKRRRYFIEETPLCQE